MMYEGAQDDSRPITPRTDVPQEVNVQVGWLRREVRAPVYIPFLSPLLIQSLGFGHICSAGSL